METGFSGRVCKSMSDRRLCIFYLQRLPPTFPSHGVCLGGARLGNRTLKRTETRISRMSLFLAHVGPRTLFAGQEPSDFSEALCHCHPSACRAGPGPEPCDG